MELDAALHCALPSWDMSADAVDCELISPAEINSLWEPEFDAEELDFLRDLDVCDLLGDDLELDAHLDMELVLDVRAHSAADLSSAFDSLVNNLSTYADQMTTHIERKYVSSRRGRCLKRRRAQRNLFFKKVVRYVEIFHNSIPLEHLGRFWHAKTPLRKFLRKNYRYLLPCKEGHYMLTVAGKTKFRIPPL